MKYEDENLAEEKKMKAMKWFKTICNPDFQLVDSLVTLFIDNLDKAELCRKILKVLKKFNEYLPELVGDQFFNNLNFP